MPDARGAAGRDSWVYLPNDVLEGQRREEQAKAWGDSERARLAAEWAETARKQNEEWFAQQYAGQGILPPGEQGPLEPLRPVTTFIGEKLGQAAELTGRSQQALFGGLNEAIKQPPVPLEELDNPEYRPEALSAIQRGLLEGLRGERYTQGTQLLESAGMPEGPVRNVLGFGLDVGLDPFNLPAPYAGPLLRAAGKGAKTAARGIGEAAADVARSPMARELATSELGAAGRLSKAKQAANAIGKPAPAAVPGVPPAGARRVPEPSAKVGDTIPPTEVPPTVLPAPKPGRAPFYPKQRPERPFDAISRPEPEMAPAEAVPSSGAGLPPTRPPTAVAAAAGPPAPKSSNAATQKLLTMYTGKAVAGNAPSIAHRWEAVTRFAVRHATDQKVDLARFQNDASKALGRPLNADEMAYELSRLTPDMAARVKVQEQIRPALQLVGDDRPLLSVYLTHWDNVDVAAAMGNEARKFSGGLSAAESRAALADMTAEFGRQRMAKIEQAAQQILDANKTALKAKLDSGIISQQLYDDLTAKYPHYVPTRITDYLKDPEMVPVGKKLSLSDTGLRRNTIEGTTRAREDPLASTVRNIYETERLVRKNNAINAFLRLRQAKPEYQNLIREVPHSYSLKAGEKAITGFVDGVKKRYVMPSGLAQAVEWEGPPNIAFLSWTMNLWKSLITSKSPAFLASNALLDAGTFLIRETSRAGGPTPVNLYKVTKALAEAYQDVFKGLLTRTYHGKTAEYLKSGGGFGGWFQPSAEGARQSVKQLARENVFTVKGSDDAKRILLDLLKLEPITAVGERIELAPRVASMKLAEQAGANSVRKIINGRTVTIDFDQGGRTAKALNQLIPFFNVGMQAGAQMVRTMIENRKGALATFLGGPAALTVAAEAWNNSDPERRKAWDDVPRYIKDRHIGFVVSGAYTTDQNGNRRPLILSLPMREYAPLVIGTREVVNRVLGKDARPWNELLSGALTQVSPVQGDTVTQAAGGLVFPGVSTALELGINKNFYTGGAIASEYRDQAASAASKGIANALPAEWGVRPSQIEYAARDLGGGVSAAALAASDIAAGTTQDQGVRSVPIVGGIAGRFMRSDIGGNLEKAQEELLSDESKRILKDAGVRIGVSPVMSSINKVPLTLDEQTQYQTRVNELIDQAVKYVAAIPGYDTASPDDREAAFRKYFDLARAKAREEMQAQIGSAEGKRRLLAGTAGGQR